MPILIILSAVILQPLGFFLSQSPYHLLELSREEDVHGLLRDFREQIAFYDTYKRSFNYVNSSFYNSNGKMYILKGHTDTWFSLKLI